MKKLLLISLAVMMVVTLAVGVTYAGNTSGIYSMSADYGNISSYVVSLTSADDELEAISTATISNRNRILGYTVSGQGAAAIASLYDGTAGSDAVNANIISEFGCASNTSDTFWFPFPIQLTNGLVVVVNASTTKVVIYYI